MIKELTLVIDIDLADDSSLLNVGVNTGKSNKDVTHIIELDIFSGLERTITSEEKLFRRLDIEALVGKEQEDQMLAATAPA